MTAPGGRFVSGPLALQDAALFTDFYELTMGAAYLREGLNEPATFSLFVRRLPAERDFLVAAGLADVLAFLQDFRVTPRAVEYLRSLGRFDEAFLDFLRALRFTGSVRAVPEGTLLFAEEPLLEVTAPLIEAQMVETAVINICHLQTMLASKAVRSVLAAGGRPVVDFGLRRAHGTDAGMKAARCAYLAGAVATSNVLAAAEYDIPPAGTMAHSFVAAFPSEIEAFRAFARAFPGGTTLLIDTYDTVAAAHKAVTVAREMEERGARLGAVRLDSGDLVALSRAVREVFDAAGLDYVRIFASGGLDEAQIATLLAQGAPIDAFGVGTRMDVSADAPYMDMAYKLVRVHERDVLKLSEGKATWPGEKQVYRFRGPDDRWQRDVLALREEAPPAPDAVPLLETVMTDGRLVAPPAALSVARDRCLQQVAALPDTLRDVTRAGRYPVEYSPGLRALRRSLEAAFGTTPVAPVEP